MTDNHLNIGDMLRYKRPHGSRSEQTFINRYLRSRKFEQDAFGNMWAHIGPFDNARVLWSAHSDTVHKTSGRQAIVIHDGIARLAVPKKARGECLGADNAAGVYILLRMFDAGVPGVYCVHRQEENGGKGSAWSASQFANDLTGIQACVAFDRRGTKDIISEQCVGMTASTEFCESLADAIGLGHKPSNMGTFTDTASYADIIPECTNVAAGFLNEHTSGETLDTGYLEDLASAMIDVDVDKLIIKRTPGDYGYSRDWQYPEPMAPMTLLEKNGSIYEYAGRGYRDLVLLVRDNPEGIADLLDTNGLDYATVRDLLSESGYLTEYGRVDRDYAS